VNVGEQAGVLRLGVGELVLHFFKLAGNADDVKGHDGGGDGEDEEEDKGRDADE